MLGKKDWFTNAKFSVKILNFHYVRRILSFGKKVVIIQTCNTCYNVKKKKEKRQTFELKNSVHKLYLNVKFNEVKH